MEKASFLLKFWKSLKCRRNTKKKMFTIANWHSDTQTGGTGGNPKFPPSWVLTGGIWILGRKPIFLQYGHVRDKFNNLLCICRAEIFKLCICRAEKCDMKKWKFDKNDDFSQKNLTDREIFGPRILQRILRKTKHICKSFHQITRCNINNIIIHLGFFEYLISSWIAMISSSFPSASAAKMCLAQTFSHAASGSFSLRFSFDMLPGRR